MRHQCAGAGAVKNFHNGGLCEHRRAFKWKRPPVSSDGLENSTREMASNRLQLIRRTLAGATVLYKFVAQFLSLAQITHASAFDGADVHENVSAAVVGLNETKTFL